MLAIPEPSGNMKFGILSIIPSLGNPIKSVAHPNKNNSVRLPRVPAIPKPRPMQSKLVDDFIENGIYDDIYDAADSLKYDYGLKLVKI